MLAQDTTAIVRAVWDKHHMTPESLFGSVTPSQFVALFTKTPSVMLDRTEQLTKVNRDRGRRGLRPVLPKWL